MASMERTLRSPVGELRLVAESGALTRLDFAGAHAEGKPVGVLASRHDAALDPRSVPSPAFPRERVQGEGSGRAAGQAFAETEPESSLVSGASNDAAILDRAERELREYFAGERREFTLPLAPRGTEFQMRVWAALREIPYGVTASYGEVAARIGKPSASRAVGMANGRNPLAIVVPCHRVIGASGGLTGYGGGMERKRYLLELEGAALRLG